MFLRNCAARAVPRPIHRRRGMKRDLTLAVRERGYPSDNVKCSTEETPWTAGRGAVL
jgi:hypothetical protein